MEMDTTPKRARIGRILGWIVVATTLTGCAPYIDRYRYIELRPSTGLTTDMVGRPQHPATWFVGSLPERYHLARPDYVIVMTRPAEALLPALTIRLASPDHPGWTLRASANLDTSLNKGILCAAYDPGEDPAQLELGWSAACDDPELEKWLEFDVVDGNGRVRAHERLRFDLRSSGWYVLLDAV